MGNTYSLDKDAYVLIFHHNQFKNTGMNRQGDEKDVERLKVFFDNYKAKTEFKANQTVKNVKETMRMTKEMDFSNYSCLIMIIMSHGKKHGIIEAYDGTYDFENDVVELILANNTLKNKPKLFFVQSCKGDGRMEIDSTSYTTNKNDILKCFSAYEGTVSYRDPNTGSIFIQKLFNLIDSNPNKEIRELMNMLRDELVSEKIPQAPTDTSTLTKKFYFSALKKKSVGMMVSSISATFLALLWLWL
ncbi:caspase-7-like [Uranotaenia lowii]|uniref:caspase-7-like n=1 Tax=Uranotaenia lowii TaxID=190385 RepID=UPI00247ABC4D|nr:caspase-7-like [Uranotaenia lowii]